MKTARSLSTVSLQLLKDCVINTIPLQWLPRRKSRFGRPHYCSMSLFLLLLLGIREHVANDSSLERKLLENATYRSFCGFTKQNIPSHDTISRFRRKLTEKRLTTLLQRVDRKLTRNGVFQKDELAVDATDILTNARNKHNPDFDAGYGYKSDGERFHGYWAVFAAGTRSEIPRAIQVTPANIHQSMTCQEIFDQLEQRDLQGASQFFADAAYDDKKTYHRCIDLGMVPLIAYNPKRARIKRFENLHPQNWRKHSLGDEGCRIRKKYRGPRVSVERYQSTFKEMLQGRSIPVRGLHKAKKYLFLTTILIQLYALTNHMIETIQTHRNSFSLLHYFNKV